MKHLDNISDSKIMELHVPPGIPLIYELNSEMAPIRHYYLADDKTVAAAISRAAGLDGSE
uniref:Uncharacterized protein n=1 Tax=Mesocestoides corti TaxID=53468 RepID=A0A5K3FKN5_MESCO